MPEVWKRSFYSLVPSRPCNLYSAGSEIRSFLVPDHSCYVMYEFECFIHKTSHKTTRLLSQLLEEKKNDSNLNFNERHQTKRLLFQKHSSEHTFSEQQ